MGSTDAAISGVFKKKGSSWLSSLPLFGNLKYAEVATQTQRHHSKPREPCLLGKPHHHWNSRCPTLRVSTTTCKIIGTDFLPCFGRKSSFNAANTMFRQSTQTGVRYDLSLTDWLHLQRSDGA